MSFDTKPTVSSEAKPLSQGEQLAKSRKHLLWATVLTIALMFVPYSNYALYPLRLFITFIHESGHALAAVLTGGSVESLSVHTNGEGLTIGRFSGAWTWLFSSAGYLGTAVFGAITLHIGRMTAFKSPGRAALYVMAFSVWIITALWGFHPLQDMFTIGVGVVLGVILFAMARFLPKGGADFAAAFLAVQCSLNALGDIRILLSLTTSGASFNDAQVMQKTYALPATFWAGLWAVTAVGILLVSLKVYLRGTKSRPAQKALAQ